MDEYRYVGDIKVHPQYHLVPDYYIKAFPNAKWDEPLPSLWDALPKEKWVKNIE